MIQMRRLNSDAGPAERVERYDTIVVGAGQAGLAAGYYLARDDSDFLILNGDAHVGDSWRNRWDSLRLFTPAAYSSLPGLCFPAPPYHLPDKDQTADYLAQYAERFDLPVRASSRVTSLTRSDDFFVLRTNARTFEARNVIVATGPFHTPRTPAFAAEVDPSIVSLHSSEYRNPWQLPEGDALVVGVGNSGAQIALELSRSRNVYLSGRASGALPRRLAGRDIYDWIWPVLTRAHRNTLIGRRLREKSKSADPLIGMRARDLTIPRITRTSRVTGVRNGKPVADGSTLNVTSIVWCTGFDEDFSWIQLPVLDAARRPLQMRGISTSQPGLSFLGLRFMHTQTSALIGGVGADAEHVTRTIGPSIAPQTPRHCCHATPRTRLPHVPPLR